MPFDAASATASASRPLTHDAGAQIGKQFGDREPDAAGAADDDGAAAGQRALVSLRPRLPNFMTSMFQ